MFWSEEIAFSESVVSLNANVLLFVTHAFVVVFLPCLTENHKFGKWTQMERGTCFRKFGRAGWQVRGPAGKVPMRVSKTLTCGSTDFQTTIVFDIFREIGLRKFGFFFEGRIEQVMRF